ncbi:MAG: YHS domain-containing (seleno)protein, partial [Cyanobacteria bacterium J06641_5]
AAHAANPCAANPCAANPCAASSSSSVTTLAYAPATYSDPKTDPGIAIRGYDTVSYFTEGQPVEGSSEFTYFWRGAAWRFSSAENLALFASNPESYAPQYGGYCAQALSDGALASTIPEAWKIVNGKLYLNYSSQAQQEWESDIPGKIARADGFWPNVLATADTIFYDSGTVKLAKK